jgi:hypothetical protein
MMIVIPSASLAANPMLAVVPLRFVPDLTGVAKKYYYLIWTYSL